MKKLILLCSVIVMSTAMNAQIFGSAYIEYGYGFFKYKSDQLLVFTDSYNSVNAPAKPFGNKVGTAKGDFIKFGFGFGEQVGMMIDFAIYKMESNPMSARFADGSGRDIWYQVRNSNTTVGIKFGGTREFPLWGQFNMNIAIQDVSLLTAYVFPDGSRSLGRDHALNGVYSDFNLIGGLGFSAGCKILGPLAVTASIDYTGRGIDSKSHPEYHEYSDNNDVGNSLGYIPRDVAAYNSGSYATENSIHNDFRGWNFTFGAVFILTSEEK
jgi:hypothetical protein